MATKLSHLAERWQALTKALYIARDMHVLHLHQIGGGRRLQRENGMFQKPLRTGHRKLLNPLTQESTDDAFRNQFFLERPAISGTREATVTVAF